MYKNFIREAPVAFDEEKDVKFRSSSNNMRNLKYVLIVGLNVKCSSIVLLMFNYLSKIRIFIE